jgi:hypothetical protein
MRSPLRRTWQRLAAVAAGFLSLTLPANADEDEVSIHVRALYGAAVLGDAMAYERAIPVDFVGVGIQATYATSNWYAYEAQLSYALSEAGNYHIDADTSLLRAQEWVRLDVGIAARLGDLLTPTAQAAIGVQQRMAGEGRWLDEGWISPAGEARHVELVGTLGVGLDYRITGHWLAGAGVTAQRSLSSGPRYRAIAGLLHLAYYWYWFPGNEQ